jgi:outer membrane protein
MVAALALCFCLAGASAALAAAMPLDDTVRASEAPLTLDEAVAVALQHNPDVRAAAERIGQAEAHLGEATAAFYPRVDARLVYARTDNPAQAFMMILNQRRFSFNLDFNDPGPTQNVRPEIIGAVPLFRGGQDYYRRQAAQLGVEAAQLERLAVRNALTDAVIAAYYALMAAPQEVEAARASIDAVSSARAQAQARFDAGAALESDLLSLDVRLAEAREGQVQAANAVEQARAGLRVLLALPAEAPLNVVSVAGQPPADVPAAVADALAQALRARPELGAAARQVGMREREVAAERAAYLPKVDVIGGFANDSSNFELTHEQDSWAFGVTAEVNVFEGFRTRERVRAAERQLAEAREMERKTRLDVEHEVQTSFLAYAAARQRDQVAQAAIASAENALRLVNEQYAAGTVTITRYLEAEAARTAARSRAIAARFELRRAEAALKKAMGVWADAGGLDS